MERDIDKVIQQKVFEAEASPLPWNNDRVWRAVAPDVGRKHRTVWFVAAACVAGIVVVALTFSNYQHYRTSDKSAASKQVQKSPGRTAPLHVDTITQVTEIQNSHNKTSEEKRIDKIRRATKSPLSIPEGIVAHPEDTLTVAGVNIRTQEPDTMKIAEAAAEIPQKIQPIVGTIDTYTIAGEERTRKKKKVNLLRSDIPAYTQAEESHTIFSVRIKKQSQ